MPKPPRPPKQEPESRKRPFTQVDSGIPPNVEPTTLSHLFSDAAVAPWISRQEWMDVYLKLSPVLANPEDPQLLAALDVASLGQIIHSCWGVAWGARNETANLTIHILEALKALQLADTTTACMAAYMLVIRFVKTISEPLHVKNQVRRTIMDICKSIGVPPWIVQLRHDGSHGDMQDSHVVRDALIFAIQWLKSNFWDVEAGRIGQSCYMMKTEKESCLGDGQSPEDSIRSALIKYRRSLKEVEGKRARKNGRFAQMKNLDVLTSSHLNEFTTILVADFIAPPVVMVTDGRNDENEKYPQREKKPQLSRRSEEEWYPVVAQVLLHSGGTDSLLRSFATLLGDADRNRDYLISAWIHRVLGETPRNSVSSVRIWDAVNWTVICEMVTARPSFYSTGILQVLTSWVNNAREHKLIQDSIRLAKVANAKVAVRSASDGRTTRTVDGLLEELRIANSALSLQVAQKSPWALANDINWSNLPIGLLPHQIDPKFDLFASLLLPSLPECTAAS